MLIDELKDVVALAKLGDFGPLQRWYELVSNMITLEKANEGGTHFDAIETGMICHPECAIAEIKRLRQEVIKLSL